LRTNATIFSRAGARGRQHGFGNLLRCVWRVPLRQSSLHLLVHRGLLNHVQQQLD
jgi:hypothetical protein